MVPDAVDPAALDESPLPGELPIAHAQRLAEAKAAIVGERHPSAYVLAGDTVVAAGRRILPKAETEEQARACLELLSGRRHRVHSALTLVAPGGGARHRLSTSIVTFRRLHPDDIAAYLACREWEGKAGGYAIQGRAEAFVRFMSGSWSGIVGLPLYDARALLVAAGFALG